MYLFTTAFFLEVGYQKNTLFTTLLYFIFILKQTLGSVMNFELKKKTSTEYVVLVKFFKFLLTLTYINDI